MQNQGHLPEPNNCDSCCSPNVDFVNNSEIYGASYGRWPYVWFCKDCRASVGCHEGTRSPLGLMADAHIRMLRAKAHSHFDRLWKEGYMSRQKAYSWLSHELGMQRDECHISRLSVMHLKKTAHVAEQYLEQNLKVLLRRKEKNRAKKSKRNERKFVRDAGHDGSFERQKRIKRQRQRTEYEAFFE